MAALPAAGQDTKPPIDACVECHSAQTPPLSTPVKLLEDDIHATFHLSCADCHHGDASVEDVAAHKGAGFVGRPRGIEVAKMCGGCHSDIEKMRTFNPQLPTDQQARYMTSVHGKLAATGDDKAATCVACHGSHGIRRVSDPASPVSPMHVVETCTHCHADPAYMKPYKLATGAPIPTDQLSGYRESVHGHARLVERDPGAPACNTCHSGHGSGPPGLASVFDACGKCHQTQSDLFQTSAHAKAFAERYGKHEIASPSCTECHGKHEIRHADDTLFGGPTCATCHTKGDPGDRATVAMRAALDALASDVATAEAKLSLAESVGMDVAGAHVQLAAARESMIQARVVVHAFSQAQLEATVKEGRGAAAAVTSASEAALGEHAYRRQGLAVASACLVVFATMLALKARRVAARSAPIHTESEIS
jgi:hypothetical protein